VAHAIEEPKLKASAQEQQQLLIVQQLDTKLDQLDYRERTLPQNVELAAVNERIAELQTDVVNAQTELTDLTRAVTRAEAEVEQVRARARKDQELLDSGRVGSKQLEDLQREIQSLSRRQSDLEDAELELMEVAEEVQNRVSIIADAIAAAQARKAELTAARDEVLAEVNNLRARAAVERSEVVELVTADLLALYTKLRTDLRGVGAAPLRGSRCEGCHMQLNPTDLKVVKDAAPDDVMRCEECRRILVRDPG
jgi:uncharacterized protein